MKRIIIALLAMAAILAAMAVPGFAFEERFISKDKFESPITLFPLEAVKLTDSPFKTAMELDHKYLLDLDPDRLLHMFRVTAGLPSKAEPLGGWESPDCELRGHFMGHYLSGLSLMYAATRDEVLKQRLDYVVAELAKCQNAMPSKGYNEGYLSAYPESFFDRVDKGEPVWAPWYTYHKILAGMIDAVKHGKNGQAISVLRKMEDWVKLRTDKLSDEQMQKSLNNEFGGMGEAFANLYPITRNPRTLKLAQRFEKKWFTGPLIKGEDNLKGLHSNTHIPQVIAAARLRELLDDQNYENMCKFFWKETALARSFATGGTSNYEFWRTEPNKMAGEISVESQETCCTYNMLKLTKHLFCWTGEPQYADYYERALYNSILSTIHPDNGMTMYYVSMKPGHFKVFGKPNDSFWCCTGTGVENHAMYGESIYFHDDKALYINLFIPSVLEWQEKSLRVQMQTDFPESGKVLITLQPQQKQNLEVKLRIPYWATSGVTVRVNGKEEKVKATPSSYVTLRSDWENGDTIEMDLPMGLRLAPMPDDPKLAAVMYGPLVLAGKLGTENFTKDMQFQGDQRAMHGAPSINVPYLVSAGSNVETWLKPVPGKTLTWKTSSVGKPKEITMVPFYKLFDERYSVYWRFYTAEEYKTIQNENKAREKESTAAKARTIDSVDIGVTASESAHALNSDKSSAGAFGGGKYRHTEPGGWFSYDLKVDGSQQMTLRCSYWGADSNRKFEILVDGKQIGQESLTGNKGQNLFSVEYPIPQELTKGKSKVTVRFQSQSNTIVGGVFGLAVLKP